MNNNVYIVGTHVVLPQFFPTVEVMDAIYREELCGSRVNRLAKKMAASAQIRNRAISIDLSRFPQKLVAPQDSPVQWGKTAADHLMQRLPRDEVGFVSVSYNISSHQDVVPNLAVRISQASRFRDLAPPEQFVHYGCASGIWSIESAVKFCREKYASAFVFAFEQCSWIMNPIYDELDSRFGASLRGNAIFGDGGVGMLLVSERSAGTFDKRLRILDTETHFEFGEAIGMDGEHFLVGDKVKDVMPRLVSEKAIKPLLRRNSLTAADVKEWSIHQGGFHVLEQFLEPDILGLTQAQIEPSREMFKAYGNMSSASNFVVLDWHMRRGASTGDYGVVVGFGAGYYLGAVLYRHE